VAPWLCWLCCIVVHTSGVRSLCQGLLTSPSLLDALWMTGSVCEHGLEDNGLNDILPRKLNELGEVPLAISCCIIDLICSQSQSFPRLPLLGENTHFLLLVSSLCFVSIPSHCAHVVLAHKLLHSYTLPSSHTATTRPQGCSLTPYYPTFVPALW
jgi:hypothetical protein